VVKAKLETDGRRDFCCCSCTCSGQRNFPVRMQPQPRQQASLFVIAGPGIWGTISDSEAYELPNKKKGRTDRYGASFGVSLNCYWDIQ
jgi:hypothetical protein